MNVFFFNLGLWYCLKLLFTISLGLEVGVVYGLIFFSQNHYFYLYRY
jgi:hypothetical protein